MNLRARYYDGRQALTREVTVAVDKGEFRLVGENIDVTYPLEQIQVQPPLANIPRLILLPAGDTCEVPDQRACDELLGCQSRGGPAIEGWVDRLERRGSYALAALGIAALATLVIIWFGIPFVSARIAQRISPSLEAALGEQTLAALDQLALSDTRIDSARHAELRQRFDALARAAGGDLRLSLVFRRSPDVGPNAFALPGGTIVLLDELVELATDSNQIAAVLCHEIGHVSGRHSVRAVIQNSASVAFLGLVLGDVSSVSAYAAAIPSVLLTSSYSREFEREADEYGLALMERAGIPPEALSDILLRIDALEKGGPYPNFLSSHPSTAERVQQIRKR